VQVSEGLALGSDLEDALSGRRWPVFAPAAMQRGVRAVFAFPLTIGSIRVGVMGLYRDSAGPLPPAQLRDCLLLADTATVLVIEAGSHGVEDAADGDGDGAGLPGQSAICISATPSFVISSPCVRAPKWAIPRRRQATRSSTSTSRW